MGPSLMTVAIIVAALVIRTVVMELRAPGSARQEWAFATNGSAVSAGVSAAVLLSAMGWQSMGYAALAWSTLAGVLVAYIVGRRPPPG